MFGKMKKWLGIEGVKVEIILPEEIDKAEQEIIGKLKFTSMSSQFISGIYLKMIEKYTRGRKQDKLIDEYVLGEVQINKGFEIEAGTEKIIDFILPYRIIKSEIDQMGDNNIIMKGISSLAKTIRSVKSEYRIEVEAFVEGTRFHPFDKKSIKLK